MVSFPMDSSRTDPGPPPARPRRRAFAAAVAFAWSCSAGAGWPQTPAEAEAAFRVFTNKEGKTLDARIVSVEPDRKTLRIALRDGKEVSLPIVLLSLDDQQFLKEWLGDRPISSPFRVQVDVEKVAARPADRRRSFSYRLNTDHVAYRIRLKNLSRETMVAPVVEYFVLTEETIRIYVDSDDGDWTFSGGGGGESTPVSVHEVTTLPDLAYNRDHELTTSPVEVDQVIGDGNDVYGEDRLVGAIVQVRDQNGNVAGVWRSADPGVAKLEWDQIVPPAEAAADGAQEVRRAEAPQGGSIPAGELDLAGRPFLIRARISPGSDGQGGVIAAQGDETGGWVLRLAGRRVTFAIASGEGRTRQVTGTLPGEDDAVRLAVQFSPDRIELSANDEPIGEGVSPGLFRQSPAGPITVGHALGASIRLQEGEAPSFDGTIEDFMVRAGPRAGSGAVN